MSKSQAATLHGKISGGGRLWSCALCFFPLGFVFNLVMFALLQYRHSDADACESIHSAGAEK